MSDKKLRVGIIGVGLIAVLAHAPRLRATGRAEVTAICRRNPERLAMAQQALQVAETYTDWHEMLDQANLDAVVVSTPHHAHFEPVMAALQRGLHVLVDKPMALSSQEAWTMMEAAERAKRVLMVSCGRRALGKWRFVKQLIATGAIGRLRQINCAVSAYRRWFWEAERIPTDVMELLDTFGLPREFYDDWQGWHGDPTQMGGGAFIDIGIHWLDSLLWLAGAPAIEIVAFTENAGLPVESFINVQARLANEVLLSMTFADAVPQGLFSEDQHLMIVGEQGVITDDPGAEGERGEGRSLWLFRDNIRHKLETDLPDTTLAAPFVESILDGKENPSPADQGAYAVEFIEALYRSAAEGQIIHLPKRGI